MKLIDTKKYAIKNFHFYLENQKNKLILFEKR